MDSIVMCRVSGGVTGFRQAPLKENGKIVKFKTLEEAIAEAKRLGAIPDPHSQATFTYWAYTPRGDDEIFDDGHKFDRNVRTLSQAEGTMEKVTCDWLTRATEADRNEFPDSYQWHVKHGDNIAECDAWVCPCGNSTDTGGFRPCDANGNEVEPPDLGSTDILRFACNDCGRIILHSTGEVIGCNPNGTLL